MRKSDRKKTQERIVLERFIEASGLPIEILVDREDPDFLVCFEGRTIGFEVTQLFIDHSANGPVPQAQESISDKIVLLARQIYERTGGFPAHVSVGFFTNRDLRRIRRDDFAEQLASFVRSQNLTAYERKDWRPGGEGSLPSDIAFVHALGVPTREMACWTVARAGWIAPLTVEMLQARIDEKAALLSNYQASIEENWLLIVANGMRPSQLFEVGPDFDATKVLSPFGRTYFYSDPGPAIVRIGTDRE